MKKLIKDWTQWLIDKIKKNDQCIQCLKKNHRYDDKNASCKNQSNMIIKKTKIKLFMLQCMNEESLNALNEAMNIVNDINDFSSAFSDDSDLKNA